MTDKYFVKFTVSQYLADAVNDVVPTAAEEIEIGLGEALIEGDDAGNKTKLDAWRDAHPHTKRSADTSAKIDLAVERSAFGKDATPAGRLKAYKVYGPALFDERRLAWGASEGVIKSGSEPGKTSDEIVAKAAKIVAADEETGANSPFNPAKIYPNDQARLRDIGKYVTRFGTKSAQKACLRFGVDLAGRALQRRV